MDEKAFYPYGPDGITFVSAAAGAIKTIYAPLCGADASSLKSAITPSLSGDIKLDKFHYFTKPPSPQNFLRPPPPGGGAHASSLKSAITPSLSGDIKLDKFHYVTKPASREDLRRPSREFFVSVKGQGGCSL